MILQADDSRNHIERVRAGFEAFDFARDNRFGEFRFFAAVGDVTADSLLQVVDVVDEDAVELGHFRRNVPRHRNVDKKHGPVLAAGKELFAMFGTEYGNRRSSRGNDDIGAVACVVKVVELNGFTAKFVRESGGTLESTI